MGISNYTFLMNGTVDHNSTSQCLQQMWQTIATKYLQI